MGCVGSGALEMKISGGNFVLTRQFVDTINTKHLVCYGHMERCLAHKVVKTGL